MIVAEIGHGESVHGKQYLCNNLIRYGNDSRQLFQASNIWSWLTGYSTDSTL